MENTDVETLKLEVLKLAIATLSKAIDTQAVMQSEQYEFLKNTVQFLDNTVSRYEREAKL